MESIMALLRRGWSGLRKLRARILARQYARNKEIFYVTQGKYRICCENIFPAVDAALTEANVPIPEYCGRRAEGLSKWFFTRRFKSVIRCSVYRGKMRSKQITINAPGDLKDLLEHLNGEVRRDRTVAEPPVASPPPQRKRLNLDFHKIAEESKKNDETIEIINRHFASENIEKQTL